MGGTNPGPNDPLTATDEDWQNSVEANLMTAVRLDRALVPHMVRQRSGVVIHVSTQGSKGVQSHMLPHFAMKAALNAYSKGLANAVGEHGVRVCTLSPGVIATGIHGFAAIAEKSGQDIADVRREFERTLPVPLGRMGEPEEVAEVIAFLASPQASYLTGVFLGVDGGLLPTI